MDYHVWVLLATSPGQCATGVWVLLATSPDQCATGGPGITRVEGWILVGEDNCRSYKSCSFSAYITD